MNQPVAASVLEKALTVQAAEQDLLQAMLVVYALGGFTALHLMNARLEADVARMKRREIFFEGWIA